MPLPESVYLTAVPRAAFDIDLPAHQTRRSVALLGVLSYILVLCTFGGSVYYFSRDEIPEIVQVPGPEYPDKCKSVDILRGSYIETSPLSTFDVNSYFLIQFLTAFRYQGANNMRQKLESAVVDRFRAFVPLGKAPGLILVDVSYRRSDDYIFMFYSSIMDSQIAGAQTWDVADCPVDRKYIYFNDASTSLISVCACDVFNESTAELVMFNCSSLTQGRSMVGQVKTNVTKALLVDKVVSIVVNIKLELSCTQQYNTLPQVLANSWPIATLMYTVAAYVVLRISRCLRTKHVERQDSGGSTFGAPNHPLLTTMN